MLSHTNNPTQKIFFISIIFVIVGLAFLLQSNLFLNHDVMWLLEASRRLLAGGTYSKDFFENNPPLILYLYIPPVLMAKFFFTNIIFSLRIYIFMLALLSLGLSYSLICKIYSQQNSSIVEALTIVLAVIFLLLPVYDFGQREHLLVILTLPYILLVTNRLQNKKINAFIAYLIGTLAGLGFAIKPFFLPTLLLIELYYMLNKKYFLSWIRIECIAILAVLIAYIVILFIYNSYYLHTIVPFILRWYNGLQLPLSLIATFTPILFSLCVFLFYLIQYSNNSYRTLSNILAIVLFGYLISYFLQKTMFTYHALPAISVATFLTMVLFSFYATKNILRKIDYIKLISYGILMLVFLYHYCFGLFTIIVLFKQSYFYFFSGLFIFLFYLIYDKKNIFTLLKIGCFVPLIVVIGFMFSYMMSRTSWYSHVFLTTTFLLIILFSLFAPKSRKTQDSLLIALMGSIFFAFPYYYANIFYYSQMEKQSRLKMIISFLQAHALHRSTYFLTTGGFFPVVKYAGDVTYASRFSSFWMLPALVKSDYLYGADYDKQQKIIDKNFLINMVADDINKNKPDLIFVDVMHPNYSFLLVKKNQDHYKTEIISFDYLKYFLDNKSFKAAWESYHYFTNLEVDSPDILRSYRFEVYERNECIGMHKNCGIVQ